MASRSDYKTHKFTKFMIHRRRVRGKSAETFIGSPLKRGTYKVPSLPSLSPASPGGIINLAYLCVLDSSRSSMSYQTSVYD